jgi:hypothetical protein
MKGVLTHGLYADDFLQHTNDTAMYKRFQQKFTKRFEVKSGNVAVYLGNRITVDSNKSTVNIDQTQYIDELLTRFEISDCNPVQIPMVQRLSSMDGGEKLSVEDMKCIGTWLAVFFIWPAGLGLTLLSLFQNFLVLYPHEDNFTWQQ